jgi:uncharacterized membrane protein YhiD involved in acid resistance
VLVVLTLYGLGKFGNLIQRWGVSREEYVLTTSPDFDVERLVEVVRRENVALRGLERQETSDGGRIILVVKLPPRYRTEQLLDALGRLEGVYQVEWQH